MQVPSWTGQTCPEHSTCTLDATPDCTCGDSCPVASWKRLPQVVGSHLVKWETVTAVTDSVRTAGAANNVSFVIQPDRQVPAGSLITVAGLTGAMTADRSADAGCAITGRCFVQVLSQRMYLLISLNKSTLPQKRQLDILISNSKNIRRGGV